MFLSLAKLLRIIASEKLTMKTVQLRFCHIEKLPVHNWFADNHCTLSKWPFALIHSAWRLSMCLITAPELVLEQSIAIALVLTVPLQFTQTVIWCVLCPVEQSPVHGFICVQSVSQRGKPELWNATDHVPQSHRWKKQSYTWLKVSGQTPENHSHRCLMNIWGNWK